MMKYNEEYIVSEYRKGISTKKLAIELGTYNTSIRRILIRHNVELRDSRMAQERFVTENKFTDLQNKEVQYWLGLLATDGCITNHAIVLQLHENDKYILEAFCRFLSPKIKVNRYYNKRYKIYEYYVKFKNLDIEITLKRYGITERKSMNIQVRIPITPSFLLGCLDGDGSVITSKSQNSGRIDFLSGSLAFSKQIQEFLSENGIYSILKKARNLFVVNVTRQRDIIQLYDLLYSNVCHVHMIRKRVKYEQLIDKIKTSRYIHRCQYTSIIKELIE